MSAKSTPVIPANAITPRDQSILINLRNVKVMTLNQIRRMRWPASCDEQTARKRLSILKNRYGLIDSLHVPKVKLEANNLAYSKAYILSDRGRGWLQEAGLLAGQRFKPAQVLHDLLVAELRVRLTEAARQQKGIWRVGWYNEEAIIFFKRQTDDKATLIPDGLGVIRVQQEQNHFFTAFFVEVDASREAHGRPSSRIGRKIIGYDAYFQRRQQHEILGELPHFPLVLFVTHGEQRLQNLAETILKRRRQPVGYALALFDDTLVGQHFLKTPAWLVIPPDENVILGREQDQRQSLWHSLKWVRLKPPEAIQQKIDIESQPQSKWQQLARRNGISFPVYHINSEQWFDDAKTKRSRVNRALKQRLTQSPKKA